MAQRNKRSSSSTATSVAKVFRSNFHSLAGNTFGDEFDACLEKNLDFFVDLWEEDRYVSEKTLKDAIKLVWPKLEMLLVIQHAKSVKTLLSSLHYKKARVSSGQKSPACLSEFLNKISQTPKLPIASKPQCQKTVQSQKTVKSASIQQNASSSSSIAAMYGVVASFGSTDVLSQITVSDDLAVNECPASQISIQDSQEIKPQAKGYYFDHSECCLVRTCLGEDGCMVTDKSKMRAGKDGFAEAVFADGFVKETELTNLDVFGAPSCLKRPAAALPTVSRKKPAAAEPSQAEPSQAEPEEASQSSDEHDQVASHEIPPGLEMPRGNCKHTYADGTQLKLGKFTGQSYITSCEPGKAKYTLLIACSEKQAARNGKTHQNVMNSVWAYVTAKSSLPSKGSCKQQVLQLLGQ